MTDDLYPYACGTYSAHFLSANTGLKRVKRYSPPSIGTSGQSSPISGRA